MDSQPFQSSGRFSVDQIHNSPKNSKLNSSSSLSKSISTTISDTHSLSAILNNPQSNSDATWTSWWTPSSVKFASINVSKAGSEIVKSQLDSYLLSVYEQFNRLNDIQSHRIRESSVEFDQLGGGQGEEKLSQYLDVVELHLAKEIALRSNSFFEAQEQLERLNVRIVEGCSRMRELKETIRILDTDLVDSARQIQERNSTRSNLLVLQQKLRLILNVNHALSALKLLVASADCAGALEITDDLQQLLDGDELTGLHCFRHLGDHVNGAIDSIVPNNGYNSLTTYLEDHSFSRIYAYIHTRYWRYRCANISKIKSKGNITHTNGIDDDVKIDEEETSNIREQLLPLIIGLLRTTTLGVSQKAPVAKSTSKPKGSVKEVVSGEGRSEHQESPNDKAGEVRVTQPSHIVY
ncbi:hypothetical protein OROMI_008403 [Orobanche minor]